MISEPRGGAAPDEAYVWIWLPGATTPVVAGRLYREDGALQFNYGRSYLARGNAIAIYDPELPLRPGSIAPALGLAMPGCIRDGAPDAWGRRVILNRALGLRGRDADPERLDELTYLLDSGSDRIGALDFQASPSVYVARDTDAVGLDVLMSAAASVEAGDILPRALSDALLRGTSIGGARPKASIHAGDRTCIAKFSSSTDVHDVVKAEFVAMRLAALAGLDVAHLELRSVAGKDVLLVTRFDRHKTEAGWARHAMVSALTLFGLDEMMARYASYETFADILRHRAQDPLPTLRELFARLVFNVLCGNTDDHARNHAVFWTGQRLVLTPAYDICPQARSGFEATQAMLIHGAERASRLSTCLDAAPHFRLDRAAAEAIVANQIAAIEANWTRVCDEARLGEVERQRLRRGVFFNPYAFQGAPSHLRAPS